MDSINLTILTKDLENLNEVVEDVCIVLVKKKNEKHFQILQKV